MKNYETLNILFDDLETVCSRKFENCTKIQYQDILDLIDETITIIVTDNENPVIYNKVSFGRNLPFFSTENGNTNLNYSNDGINNTIYTAFIIVTDNNVSLISNAPTDTFIKVSHIETMQTSATQEEQEMIINLLNEGVYIK